jgi:hypothetical protein
MRRETDDAHLNHYTSTNSLCRNDVWRWRLFGSIVASLKVRLSVSLCPILMFNEC